jgi:hypothetical protein
MVTKEIVDNQLFVYMNGVLIYKRWLKQNCGMIFCKFGNFKPTDRDGK